MIDSFYGTDYRGGDDGSPYPDDSQPMQPQQPQVPLAPVGGISNDAMLAAYRGYLAQGMSPEDAIKYAQAGNGGQLPVLNPGWETHTGETTELPWIPTGQGSAAPVAQTGGTGSGGGSGAPGGGLFNPALYAPFQGQAPSYHAPTLPGAPSFDAYYDASQYPAAQYRSPTMRQAPAFVPGKFNAPTLEEAQNQPGYKFGVEQGEKALQQSRASQGLLRTGGTLKDILDYGRNAATQNYGNVFNQDLNVFKTNEGGRVNAYNTNYSTQYKDPNDYDLMNAQAAFQGQLGANRLGLDVAQARFSPAMMEYQTNAANAQRQAELGYNADWQKYLDQENVFYNNQNGPFSKYLSLAQLGAGNA